MTWYDTFADDEQKSVEELQRKGITGKPTVQKEVGIFDGAISSPFRGMAIGLNKVGDAISAPIDAVVDRVSYSLKDVSTNEFIEPYEEFKAKREKARDNLVYGTIADLEDKDNTGIVGNIGVGVGDYLWRGALGVATGGTLGAATLTGGSTGNYVYTDLTRKGVDENTALKVAGVNAVGDAIGTALPISYGFKGSGGLVADAALSVGGATGLNTGMQYASEQLLKSNGYDKQAKQYEVTGESVATDLLINSLMFGGARYLGSRQNKLDQDVDAEINQLNSDDIETRNDQVNDALVRNSFEFEDTTLPVQTTDPVQQNKHYQNLDAATEQILKGQPVSVPNTVQGEPRRNTIDYATSSLPTNAKQIALRAKQDGIDPSVALTISHIETGGKFNHTAQPPIGKDGKRLSSAYGLFQVLDDTWKNLGGKDKNSVDEQIRIGLKHIKQANNYIRKNLGRDPVAHEQYLGHLLGPGGAVKVLKADPSRPLIDVVRSYDAKNADAIVKNNGMSGMTVGEAINKWRNKWNQLSSRYGGETSTAYGMDGSSYDFAYEVKDWADLVASNDRLYGVNPLYPSELQPRDRTREASRQQIERMADDLKPELLGESPMLSNGAPIIGPDNVVESGNGRTLAIGRAYDNGRADAYREFVQNWANSRGMDISGLNQPVLVRTRLSDVDRVAFSRLANESDVAQFSATERAMSDVDRLPDSTLLKINNDGSINIDGSMDYVRSFVDQLPQSERGSVITSDGRLSQEGKRRIESAIVQRAYGDSNLVTRLSENLDDDSKNVLNALLRAAPQLSQLNDLVKQGGRFENTISQDLAQAAQKLTDLKANGLQVRDYLNQGQLIDDGLSDGARRFLEVFDNNRKSAKAISESINSEIQAIENMGDPRQGSLFGETPEEQAALDVIFSNPDQPIAVSRINSMGEPEEFTMTLRDYHAELEAEIKQSEQDILAAQTALNCALQFGAA
ncbi:lytic transglycosylase domain-containing protein [Acinetobacter baumannii]|uniref:lytic transglycosylase domain-containing protein n=1 Tax=Acinetobacter baumannii TaxID=470 RepID=UPI002341BE34|nr:lytic transglycosylase domain-containing protein [Acinetobacter baumannii]MDC4037524.1 lytic transglycosylase domain-containing protein [Acinetobacter baumannii]MDC4051989.1 lytic transglycosylase domain-containing protein [Acinetobacter baumannii]MDC4131622.1 lytic transglycosylase domain-containing protein [Acinetobacter baumannii]MDC4139880.1 lytic transglycosylase domain-containing protein [Acinetobacter baumannii]MDC4158995.1 lytic transglycosylase domain-containing protein [Acinetobac